MPSHSTVLHLPVTFVTPPGTSPEDYARFMADEAALMLEKFSPLDDITAGEPVVDPVVRAIRLNDPVGAEPGDRPDWFCAHHGEMGMDTDPEPWCHGCVEAGVTSAPADRITATSNADAAGWSDTPGGAA